MMETMCSTGIRVSELKFFTVESVRSGIVRVWNKGKYRLVVLPEKLCVKLEKYIVDRKLQSGMVFVTRNGKPVDRSNIWREMKKLADILGHSSMEVTRIYASDGIASWKEKIEQLNLVV